MEENVRKQMAEWGKKGGDINKKKGSKYFSKIGKAGAKARWEVKADAKKVTKKVTKQTKPCNLKKKKEKSSAV